VDSRSQEGHTTSRKRETVKSIKSITLKIKFDGTSSELEPLHEKLGARFVYEKSLTATIKTAEPADAIAELRSVSTAARTGVKSPKGFK
jgi:hypothetical protein